MTRWKTSEPASFEELTSLTFTIDNCLRQREAEKNYKAHKAPSSPLLSVPTPPTLLFSHQWSPCRVGACGWPWRRGKGVWAHCFTAPLRAFSRLSYWSFFFHNMAKLVSDHLNSTDKYLLKVMSAANKKAITKCWLQKCPLTGILFIFVMKQLHALEQMTCAIRLQRTQEENVGEMVLSFGSWSRLGEIVQLDHTILLLTFTAKVTIVLDFVNNHPMTSCSFLFGVYVRVCMFTVFKKKVRYLTSFSLPTWQTSLSGTLARHRLLYSVRFCASEIAFSWVCICCSLVFLNYSEFHLKSWLRPQLFSFSHLESESTSHFFILGKDRCWSIYLCHCVLLNQSRDKLFKDILFHYLQIKGKSATAQSEWGSNTGNTSKLLVF